VPKWNGHHHFFAAAAEAMRRILVERARHKARVRHGGGCQRVAVDEAEIASPLPDDDLLALHEALDELATLDPPAADLIKLRFFTGVSHHQAADLPGLSRSTADRTWLFARAWLFQQIRSEQS
jgi:RNA polymerase sigma factor (TIGR02999 family)